MIRNRRWLPGFAAAVLLGACAAEDQPDAGYTEPADIHWGYGDADGPAAWASLNSEFAVCGDGHHQSPIDVPASEPDDALPDLVPAYYILSGTIANNGHALQATVGQGGTLRAGDRMYRLLQFHQHRPSEHTIEGAGTPLEIHFVHRADDGSLAVLAFLHDVGETPSDALEALLSAATLQPGESVDVMIDGDILLPADLSYATYSGSLTAPPCTEGVEWFILHERGSTTADQLARLARAVAPNARPVMPLADRTVRHHSPQR